MKTQILRIVAGLAMAIAAFSAPQGASAAPPPAERIIDMTVCWTLTTIGPNGCNASWGSEPLTLVGNGNKGDLYYARGTPSEMKGRYTFSAGQTKLVMKFTRPEVTVRSTEFTGMRYLPDGPNCYRGTMVADYVSGADLTGVWFGCIRP